MHSFAADSKKCTFPLISFSVLFAATLSVFGDEKAAATPEKKKGAAEGAAPAAGQPLDCSRELEALRLLQKELPPSFLGLGGKEIKEATQRVKTCRDRAEAFLQSCKASPGVAEVELILGKGLRILNQVSWSELYTARVKAGEKAEDILGDRKKWAADYYRRIIDLATGAARRLPPDDPLRFDALTLQGDALVQAGSPKEALEVYRKLLADFPRAKADAHTIQAAAAAALELRDHDEGIRLVRQGMKDFPDDPTYPSFLELLWRLHFGKGDLPALPAIAKEAMETLPSRLKNEKLTRAERDSCERTLVSSGFRLGLARFAIGEAPLAVQAFSQNKKYIQDLKKSRSSVPPDFDVYSRRSGDNIEILRSRWGERAPAELGKVMWADGRFSLHPGRPTALLFRARNDDRSAPFLKLLDIHHEKDREAYDLAAISFLKVGGKAEDSIAALQQEAGKLGLHCPVGFDPDPFGHSLFLAAGASVGSATFIIFDAQGKYAWFQQDPREIDANFSLAVLERILAAQK